MSKVRKQIVSLYAGPVTREQSKPRFCRTVGELRAALANYHDDLPLADNLSSYDADEGCTPGAALIWFNIGRTDAWAPEHLKIEPNDGTWEGLE